jgi:hypothetical protein
MACVIACWVVLTLGLVGGQSRYAYIVEVTTKMMALNARGADASNAEAAIVAKQGCDALGVLLKDELFQHDLKKWAGSQKEFQDQRVEFKRDLTLFVNEFLLPERSILQKAGFDPTAIDQMLMHVAVVRASVDTSVDYNRVMRNIDNLRMHLCQGASHLKAEANRTSTYQSIRRWTTGIFGVGLVVADVALAPTVVASLSGVAGALITEEAVDLFPKSQY